DAAGRRSDPLVPHRAASRAVPMRRLGHLLRRAPEAFDVAPPGLALEQGGRPKRVVDGGSAPATLENTLHTRNPVYSDSVFDACDDVESYETVGPSAVVVIARDFGQTVDRRPG